MIAKSTSSCTNWIQTRKLLGYACSFITFSPNFQNVEALAKLVASEKLSEPCQLLDPPAPQSLFK